MTLLLDDVTLEHDGTEDATLDVSGNSGVALVLQTDGRVELVTAHSLDGGETWSDPDLTDDHPDLGTTASGYFTVATLGCTDIRFTVINESDRAVTVTLQASVY